MDCPKCAALAETLCASEAERERLTKEFENMERGRNWFHRNSVEQAETIASLTATLEYAEDRLHEINVSNYDHDDACRLNERSVEVILAIRHALKDVRTRPSGGDSGGEEGQ